MMELGEHCHTHIIPRMKKVIDGQDPGGITKAVNWQGGGGFRYFRLAPSLLEKDKWDNWVISKEYNLSYADRGSLQAGRFYLRPERQHLLAARPFQRAGFYLCDHPELESRSSYSL
jgi:adenine-specific DNA-methyltransferase